MDTVQRSVAAVREHPKDSLYVAMRIKITLCYKLMTLMYLRFNGYERIAVCLFVEYIIVRG